MVDLAANFAVVKAAFAVDDHVVVGGVAAALDLIKNGA